MSGKLLRKGKVAAINSKTPADRQLLQQPFGFRHEEYFAVWVVNHRANLSCDFSLPPLKFHSQDATERQIQGGHAAHQSCVTY